MFLACFYGLSAWLFSAKGAIESYVVCLWLAETNVFLVIFNMIPGYPLDGGRVLRAILWARTGRLRHSTYITSRIGIGFSWFLMALGAVLIVALSLALCVVPFTGTYAQSKSRSSRPQPESSLPSKGEVDGALVGAIAAVVPVAAGWPAGWRGGQLSAKVPVRRIGCQRW